MIKKDYQDQIVWIIGASSGIGSALARELAARGATLALCARRQEDLEALKAELGDHHQVFVLDVTDAHKTVRTAQAVHTAFGRIDRVIFMAAAYTPMDIDHLDMDTAKQMIETNLIGALNVVSAALSLLKTQESKGQIALCGSVAGYIGLPGGQPYSASKAGIINLAESLYGECKDFVDVKLISPGFVRTALTDKNSFAMPMMLEPDQAAKEIAQGLLSRRFEIHFPKKFTFFLKILALLPYGLCLRMTQCMKK